MKTLVLWALALTLALLLPAAAFCAPSPGYRLELGLKAPVWSQAFGGISDAGATEFSGKLTLHDLFVGVPVLSRVSPFVSATQILNGPNLYGDNKIQAGLDYRLSKNVSLSSYWDRFTDDPSGDRIFIALKWGGSGRF